MMLSREWTQMRFPPSSAISAEILSALRFLELYMTQGIVEEAAVETVVVAAVVAEKEEEEEEEDVLS